MVKLIVVIMGPGNDNFIKMCYDSVNGADKILYFTSNIEKCPSYLVDDIHFNGWNEEDKATNGKSRNVYLDHLKENYPDDWCLCLDEDEVCEDLSKVKEFIQTAEPSLYSVKMRHLIGDLGHEDATRKQHWVPNRLFKISEAGTYPLHSHPVLIQKDKTICELRLVTECTTIWHLGHLPVEYMNYINKRYKQHKNDSVVHSDDFKDRWRLSHLFGVYPTSNFNVLELPKIILDNFDLDFDELYFNGRKNFDGKHYQDCIDWKNYFKCQSAILFGCGFGQRVKILNDLDVNAIGVELSEYAVKNSNGLIINGDIINYNLVGKHDLAVAYDILEHLEYKDLNKAIDTLIRSSDNIIVSVPFKGTPNCEADTTHKIKETKEWWVKQFISKGLKQVEVPSHFLFKEQLMIFRK